MLIGFIIISPASEPRFVYILQLLWEDHIDLFLFSFLFLPRYWVQCVPKRRDAV